MSDKKQAPDTLIYSKEGVCNLQFSDIEVDALLSVLIFARSAAAILAQQEMTKGNSITAASKMNRIASDSKELIRIVTASVGIGEPLSDEVN